ncbi:MAG TPA: hypothetical protein VNW46_04270 [Gemmatimonadaceae bacterium]|nr:hypothetical protein [Gemmatimonadaceae bacterium]
MRHVLSLFALALVPIAHAPGGYATAAPFIRIHAAPHALSTGVSVQVKAQLSNTSTFSSWWWGTQVWFTSSNTAVVKVTDTGWNTSAGVVGTITAVGPGTATVTVHDESGTTATDDISVSGTGAPLASIRIQCANGAWCDRASGRTVSVGAGTSQQMFVVGLDASGNVLWKAPVQ